MEKRITHKSQYNMLRSFAIIFLTIHAQSLETLKRKIQLQNKINVQTEVKKEKSSTQK